MGLSQPVTIEPSRKFEPGSARPLPPQAFLQLLDHRRERCHPALSTKGVTSSVSAPQLRAGPETRSSPAYLHVRRLVNWAAPTVPPDPPHGGSSMRPRHCPTTALPSGASSCTHRSSF